MNRPFMAIDPGSEKSAYVVFDEHNRPTTYGTGWNRTLKEVIQVFQGDLVCEWLSSYGKPVGKEVFETAFWVGMFFGVNEGYRLTRREVKKLLGLTKPKTTDAVVREAMIERWGKLPGMKGDEWQALAVGTAHLIREGEL